MASALSPSQKLSLFEILDVPWNNSGTAGYNTMDGMGALSSQDAISGATQGVAQTQILTYLDSLNTNQPAVETVLIARITRWEAIGTTTAKIENGNVDDISGVSYDYDKERQILEERVKKIVPFYKWHEVLARKNATSSRGDGLVIQGFR